MKKSVQVLVAILILLALGFIYYSKNKTTNNLSDVKNISYTVEGQEFTMKDGFAEKEIAPGSETKNKLFIFGEPVSDDFDGDKDKDRALYLVNESGGSGTFYYAVFAMNNDGVFKSTNAIFLGDRIAPQNIEVKNSEAVFNFAIRLDSEPMITPPSIGKSVVVFYEDGEIKTKEIEPVTDGGRIAAGYISGSVKIGPFCPVEIEGKPCTVQPEAYTSREVIVYEKDGETIRERVKLDLEGNYKIAIGPGTYFVQIKPAGIGEGEKKKVVVISFETSVVDFDVDTGIR